MTAHVDLQWCRYSQYQRPNVTRRQGHAFHANMDEYADGLALPAQQFSHCEAHLVLRRARVSRGEILDMLNARATTFSLSLLSSLLRKRDHRPLAPRRFNFLLLRHLR
jgi:hypothetical protein